MPKEIIWGPVGEKNTLQARHSFSPPPLAEFIWAYISVQPNYVSMFCQPPLTDSCRIVGQV
jgi:hypothetical protein